MVPQRLDLDFVAPPLAARVNRGLLIIGLVAAAIGATQLVAAWQMRQLQRQEVAAAAQTAPRAAVVSRSELSALRAATGVTRELTTPWGELLQAIENIATRDVVLLSVEPIAARQVLRITAEARHPDAMLDLLAKLKQQALTDVVLVSHQVLAQRPGTPIRFEVQARWAAGVAPRNEAAGLAGTAMKEQR